MRMGAFERAQRADSFYVDPAREKQWEVNTQAEQARQRIEIGALSDPQLRISLQLEKRAEQERETQRRAAAQSSGVTMGR